ncbi:MAG: hypothetical protein HYU56_05745 [Candidatus Aenigmarchaeota archaeon]|nr:hypothetical protein [Candidatus Aenigmarchaeota archaeon]
MKSYLENKWDIHFSNIVNDLKIQDKDLETAKKILKELVEEGFVMKTRCGCGENEYEYDPPMKSW